MSSQRNRLLPANAATSLAAGAGAGALGLAIGGCAIAIVMQGFSGALRPLFAFPFLLMGSFMVFLVGLNVFGLPLWMVFERLGWRRRWHAVALCAAGIYGACFGLQIALSSGDPSRSVAEIAQWTLPMALDGALVGWVVWRMAHGRRAP